MVQYYILYRDFVCDPDCSVSQWGPESRGSLGQPLGGLAARRRRGNCPGRTPPFLAVKRPARP